MCFLSTSGVNLWILVILYNTILFLFCFIGWRPKYQTFKVSGASVVQEQPLDPPQDKPKHPAEAPGEYVYFSKFYF